MHVTPDKEERLNLPQQIVFYFCNASVNDKQTVKPSQNESLYFGV